MTFGFQGSMFQSFPVTHLYSLQQESLIEFSCVHINSAKEKIAKKNVLQHEIQTQETQSAYIIIRFLSRNKYTTFFFFRNKKLYSVFAGVQVHPQFLP